MLFRSTAMAAINDVYDKFIALLDREDEDEAKTTVIDSLVKLDEYYPFVDSLKNALIAIVSVNRPDLVGGGVTEEFRDLLKKFKRFTPEDLHDHDWKYNTLMYG